jgi:hypothetical protein
VQESVGTELSPELEDSSTSSPHSTAAEAMTALREKPVMVADSFPSAQR